MDLSDGLGADLPRLTDASGVRAHVDENLLPRRRGANIAQALNDGEDYELLFAVDPEIWRSFSKQWPFKTAVTQIGFLTTEKDSCDNVGDYGYRGFDHFGQQ